MRALALLLLALPASAETITKAGDLVKDREIWDGHSACAAGKVVELDERFGRVTGKHLFRAKIDDGTGVVQVFAFGHFPKLAPGETIEACGRFNGESLRAIRAASGAQVTLGLGCALMSRRRPGRSRARRSTSRRAWRERPAPGRRPGSSSRSPSS